MSVLKLKKRDMNLDVSILQGIFENSHDPILVINPDDQILTANAAACSFLGMGKDEIGYKSLNSLVDGAGLRFIQLVRNLDHTGMAEGEITFSKNNGVKCPCKVTLGLNKNENGQSLVIMTIRDRYERKKGEEKLREDLLRFQSAFDATYDGMWDLDLSTNQLYLSSKVLKIFDYIQPSMLNRDEIMNKIFHKEDKSRIENEIHQIIDGWTDLIDVESRVKTVPGVLKWIRIRGKAMSIAKDGSITRVVGTFADITSQKLIEEDLNRKQSNFKSYVENSSIGLAVNSLDDS
jgi:PAS domain S-box-containing protein